MHVLIVANGTIISRNFYDKIIKSANKIIAADGGANNCMRLKIEPDFVIGDFDSISEKAKKKFRNILIHEPSQDKTDLEKSIEFAKKLKATKLTIIGAIGSRLDHTISNIILLLKINVPTEIFDEFNNVYLIEKEIVLSGKKGDIVSVIPISKVKGLTLEGLKWEIRNKNVDTGWIGISNSMTKNQAKISLKSGKVIVIKSRDL